MKNLIDPSGHVTQTALRDLAAGSLDPEELDEVAEHIAGCEFCALALVEVIKANQPVLVPAGFEEEVLKRIPRPGGNRAELFRFSFRVALAACIALFFVFSSAMNMLAGSRNPFEKIKAPGFSAVETINTNLRDFSQRILEMEAFKDAEKAK